MIQAITKETYRTEVKGHKHSMIVDEPVHVGGNDEGMNPHELLEASLASCSSITLRMYIQRKNWDVSEINVEVRSILGEERTGLSFAKHIQLTGNIDEKQKERLLFIAGRCPIHRLLAKNMTIGSTIEIV
ncbi:MAG: OsmC family protein [Bacteroidia bacterium]